MHEPGARGSALLPCAAPMPDTPPTAYPAIPYQAIIEQSLTGIYVLQDERFCYANATFAATVGYVPEEVIGQHVSFLVQPDFVDTVLQSYRRRLAGNPPSERFVSRARHKDGRTVLCEIHGTRTVYEGRYAMAGVSVDITERVRNEEELTRSRAQLRQLTAYTTAKLEEQRRAFARDVHDELGGMLGALKMDAARVARRVEGEELGSMTRALLALTQETIDAAKRIAEDLRPSALDHLELPVAIRKDLEAFTRRTGIRHALDASRASTDRLSPRRAVAIHRIFHEALTNAARHSGARTVHVALTVEVEHFALDLRDDGRGFDLGAIGEHSLGLLHMQERARGIGGSLRIESSPGAGTRLALTVPLL